MKSEFKVLEVIFSRMLDADIDSFFSAYLNSKFKYGKDRDVPCYDGLSYTGILSCLMDEGVVEEDLMRREVSSVTKDVCEYKLMLFVLDG